MSAACAPGGRTMSERMKEHIKFTAVLLTFGCVVALLGAAFALGDQRQADIKREKCAELDRVFPEKDVRFAANKCFIDGMEVDL